MLDFDNETRVLLHEIESPFQKQYALSIYGGMTPTQAYKHAIGLFGLPIAEDPTRAARQLANNTYIKAFLDSARLHSGRFIESESLLGFVDRMRYLGNAIIEADAQLKNGNMAAGPVLINAIKQSHLMVSTGSSDEFSHLSVDELKRLAGESE